MRWLAAFTSLVLMLGCTDTASDPGQDSAAPSADVTQAPDVPLPEPDLAPGDVREPDVPEPDVPEPDIPPPPTRSLSGTVYFFDAAGVGAIELQEDVTGAKVYLLERPETEHLLGPEGAYTFDGLPQGERFTVALEHDDYFPSLSPTITLGEDDLAGVNFQAVTWPIAAYLSIVLDADVGDESRCQMVVTVTTIHPSQNEWWAPGEPGATVTLDPPVPPAQGPYYFGTDVVPDRALAATTSDGGVIVAGAEPGVYRWTAVKEGLAFNSLELTCVGGWMTNGAPPWGLQARPPGQP